MIFKLILTLITISQIISCDRRVEKIAAVNIKFGSNIGYISIIETMRNDTTLHFDTIIHRFLPTQTNGYQFQLEFRKENSNGDYLITSLSCEKSIIISEVQINKNYRFSYLFNGIKKTEKDRTVYVTFDILCD